MGTGPFRFDAWKTNEYVRVVRNPDYSTRQGRGWTPSSFASSPIQLSLRLAFETRQVDFWCVDPWAVGHFQEDKRFDLFSAPSSSYTYVVDGTCGAQSSRTNGSSGCWPTPSMFLKWSNIFLYGHGEQSTGIFTPKNVRSSIPNIKPFAYDRKRQPTPTFAEAGWKPGKDGILGEKDGERFALPSSPTMETKSAVTSPRWFRTTSRSLASK